MSPRPAATLLLAGAAALYFGAALPSRDRAAAAHQEFRRLRDARREAEARLSALERRKATRARALATLSSPASGGAQDVPSRLRRSIVESLKAAPLSGVRLAVRPAPAPERAKVRISGQGPFSEVVRFSGHLARPEGGVVLERVRFTSNGAFLSFELEGASPGAPS